MNENGQPLIENGQPAKIGIVGQDHIFYPSNGGLLPALGSSPPRMKTIAMCTAETCGCDSQGSRHGHEIVSCGSWFFTILPCNLISTCRHRVDPDRSAPMLHRFLMHGRQDCCALVGLLSCRRCWTGCGGDKIRETIKTFHGFYWIRFATFLSNDGK